MIEYIKLLRKGGPKAIDQEITVAHLISAPSSKKRFKRCETQAGSAWLVERRFHGRVEN